MRTKLHIVVDGQSFDINPTGGISRVFRNLLESMLSIDSSVMLHLIIGSPEQGIADQEGLIVHRIAGIDFSPLFKNRAGWMIRTWIRPLLLFSATTNSASSVWHSTTGTLPPPWWKGKTVVTIHDMLIFRFPDLFSRPMHGVVRKQMRQAARRADALITPSNSTRDDVIKYLKVDPRNILVTPWAVDPSFLEETPIAPKVDKRFFLYVGTRYAYKNFHCVIKGISSVLLDREELILIVVGPAPESDEISMVNSLGIDRQVVFLDKVSDADLHLLYNTALALIYPSIYEGFGLPLVEAMVCNCPIIASSIPSSMEVAGNYATYFDPYSPDDLRQCLIQKLLVGQNSSTTYQASPQHLTWEPCARQTLELYRSLVQ